MTTVEVDAESGDYFICLPEVLLEALGWQIGDDLEPKIDRGSIILARSRQGDRSMSEP